MFYAAALTNTTLGISHGRLLVGLSIVNFPSNVTSFGCKEESVNVLRIIFSLSQYTCYTVQLYQGIKFLGCMYPYSPS